MFNLKTDYLTKLYGLSSKVDGIDFTFEDKQLEENYRKHFFQMELTKSKIFCIASISILAASLFGNLYKNHMIPIRNTYLCTAAILIEFILYILSSKCILNQPIFYFLKNVRYFISYVTLYEAVMFPFDVDVITLDVKIRSFYRILLFTMIIYMYYLDLNILVTILITISNTGVILFVQYKLGFGPNYLLTDIIATLYFNFFVFLIKKDELKNKKEVFFEYYKNSLYMDYIKEIFKVFPPRPETPKTKPYVFLRFGAVDVTKIWISPNHINSYGLGPWM